MDRLYPKSPQSEDINGIGSGRQYSGVVPVAVLGPGTRSSEVLDLERKEQAGFRTCFKEKYFIFFLIHLKFYLPSCYSARSCSSSKPDDSSPPVLQRT